MLDQSLGEIFQILVENGMIQDIINLDNPLFEPCLELIAISTVYDSNSGEPEELLSEGSGFDANKDPFQTFIKNE